MATTFPKSPFDKEFDRLGFSRPAEDAPLSLDHYYGMGWADCRKGLSQQTEILDGHLADPLSSDPRSTAQYAYDQGFADAREHRGYGFRRSNYPAAR